MLVLTNAQFFAGKGIEGDRYDTERNGPRQVTLVALEDVAAIASFLGMAMVAHENLRRNVVTSGINVLTLKDQRFRVGGAVMEGSGECAPCSLMEASLGSGGYNAVRGHGGITARIVEGGRVRVGDMIERLENSAI